MADYLTKGEFEKIRDEARKAVEGMLGQLGHTFEKNLIDGCYIPIEYSPYGKADRYGTEYYAFINKKNKGEATEADHPWCKTLTIAIGGWGSKKFFRRKLDGSIPYDKIVEEIHATIENEKRHNTASRERDRKREIVDEKLKRICDVEYVFRAGNGGEIYRKEQDLVAKGKLEGFSLEDFAMLARAGKLAFKLTVDADSLTDEIVQLLRSRLEASNTEKEEEEVA